MRGFGKFFIRYCASRFIYSGARNLAHKQMTKDSFLETVVRAFLWFLIAVGTFSLVCHVLLLLGYPLK